MASREKKTRSKKSRLWSKLRLFDGICSDVKARLRWYADDWRQGLNCGVRILAPATYVFFASAIPALAFGQQLSPETGGILTTVQILTATGLTGLLQSIIGGQPLLIVGVSEPIVLIYGYAFTYAKSRLGPELFLAWMAWACVWAGVLLILLGIFNACNYTNRFTRLSGELFGMLIAVLFMQQAIKGTLGEFRRDEAPYAKSGAEAEEFQWRLSNGLWALFIGFGTVLCSLKIQQARSWRFLNASTRSFLADYGVTLSVVFWSCLSYALRGTPEGVPRRLALPNTWDVKDTWRVAGKMSHVPGPYVAGALIPAFLIVILFYFDHTVSAQMAQLEEFNLRKPPAYNYDLFLLGWMTLLCGLIGIPPVNGVLPQAPLHTKSLITLRQQRLLAALRKAAKTHEGSGEQLKEKLAEVCRKNGSKRALDAVCTALTREEKAGSRGYDEADPAALVDGVLAPVLPSEAQEQRMTNLIQSLLVAACLGLTPGIRKMPTSVLWGYFAYLSIASLPGSQFWERFLLFFVDPSRRPPKHAGQAEASWQGKVKWRVMIAFTLFQAVYCGAVYGITWIPIAGVVFPVPILLLIPIREFLLPRIFGRSNLAALDPAPFEDGNGQPLSKTRQTPDTQRDPEDAGSGTSDVVQGAPRTPNSES